LFCEATQTDPVIDDYPNVFGAYSKGTAATFVIGPTQAADESKPGSGRVTVGYWNKAGAFRGLAAAQFDVDPA